MPNYENTISTKNAVIQKLKHSVRRLKRRITELQTQNKQKQKRMKKTKFHDDLKIISDLGSKYLSKHSLDFFVGQLKRGKRKNCKIPWSVEDKMLALSIFYRSPQTYIHCRTLFHLPCRRTVERFVEAFSFQPGFSDEIKVLLSLKMQSATIQEKLVIITMDELSLKSNLIYDSAKDCIYGFEDFGNERTNNIATSALAVMIHGLTTKCKQPLAYFYSYEQVQAEKLKKIFYDTCAYLENCGLILCAIVTDQGSNFLKFFKLLNVNAENPFIVYNKRKVYAFYDSTHLLKSIRNNLYKYRVCFDDLTACWEDIRQLYNIDQKKSYRYAPRLQEKFITLPPFSKMKVKNAAKVLSFSVSAAIRAYVQSNEMDESALGTAEFCSQMDKLFDCFNSSTRLSPSKMFRAAMSSHSVHTSELKKISEWLEKLKFLDKKTGVDFTSRLKCVEGWRQNINAVQMLWADLKNEYQFTFLLTRRLQTDPIEHLFSVVRSKNGFCLNPPPKQFRGAFKIAAVNYLLTPSSSGNCQTEDINWGQLFCDVKAFTSLSSKQPTVSSAFTNNSNELLMNIDNEESADDPLVSDIDNIPIDVEESGKFYVFGYIVKKMLEKHPPDICQNDCRPSLLEENIDNIDGDRAVFTHFKMYGQLYLVNNNVYYYLDKLEEIFRNNFENIAHEYHVAARLTLLMKMINVHDYVPNLCRNLVESIIVFFIRVRIYFVLKFENEHLSSQRSKRNLKYVQFSHL